LPFKCNLQRYSVAEGTLHKAMLGDPFTVQQISAKVGLYMCVCVCVCVCV
jgi:hypothetical protein